VLQPEFSDLKINLTALNILFAIGVKCGLLLSRQVSITNAKRQNAQENLDLRKMMLFYIMRNFVA
jgi:hypothetical protein